MDPEEVGRPTAEEVLKTCYIMNKHISALPNEVLVEIFTELKDTTYHPEQWQKVASVCRHWRAVALEAASLWTRPPTAHHDYTLLMLERSRQSPLEINLVHRTTKATGIAVLNHIWRILTLSIVDQSREALQDFQTTLLATGHKASQLRELHIKKRMSRLPFKLSATTFLEPTSLKSLRLTSIDFEWEMLPIPSLTILYLANMRISEGPSWMQFLDALREMPSLEELLFGFSDLRLHSPPLVSESLQMPCLRRLEVMSGLLSVIRNFLLTTTFPHLRNALIKCSSNDNNDDNDYSPIINATLFLVTRGDFGRFDHIQLNANRFMMSQLSPADGNLKHTLTFECERTRDGRLVEDAMAGIAASPGDRTSDLALVVCHAVLPAQIFADLFGRLPQLESLGAYAYPGVIESFKIPPLHPSDLPIPFARLQNITLHKDGNFDNDRFPLIEELRYSLLARRKCGSGVKKLCLNWELTEQEAQVLQEVVVDLDFWGFRNLRRVMAEGALSDFAGTDDEFQEDWIVDVDVDND